MRLLASARSRVIALVILIVGVLGFGLVLVPMLMVMGSISTDGADLAGTGDTDCVATGSVAGTTVQLDDDQLGNARTVISVGEQLDVPRRGQVVALATALQESTLVNLDRGDLDSVGLFQQRTSWGTFAQRTDPATAAEMFYTGGQAGQPGLLDIRGWTGMSVTAAAQAVQRSAFPTAYAKWEPTAVGLVTRIGGGDPVGCSDVTTTALPGGAVGTMLRTALDQQGDPYVWGAVGPDAFDCSGLVVYSWQQAGYRLTVRTAAQMWTLSDPVAAGDEKPGDLLFGEFGARGPGPGHVMIVVSRGEAVQAPSAGRNVETTTYTATGGWRLGRLRPSALVKLPS